MKTLYGNDSKTLLLRTSVNLLNAEQIQEITDYLLKGGNVIFLTGPIYWTIINTYKDGFTARSAGGKLIRTYTDGRIEDITPPPTFNIPKDSSYNFTLPKNNGVIYIKRLSTNGNRAVSLMIPYDNYSNTETLIAFGYGGEYVEIEKARGSNNITITNNNNIEVSVQIVISN